MGSYAFRIMVILFWLATMSWLLATKVIPPMTVGEPPQHIATLPRADEVVCWRLVWEDSQIGWSASKRVEGVGDARQLFNRVVLSTRRLPRTTKIGLASGLSGLVSDLGHVDLEARTWIEFDPLGQLNRFQTTILANNTTEWFKVYGMVDGSTLHLDVAARGIQQSKQMQLPPGSFVNNEFSPLAMMPNLRVGQRWTLPVYHPLDFMNKPTILQAEVVREDYLVWGDLARVVRVVEYTTDKSDEPRGRVWVHRDGRVLQQEVRLLGSRLTFVRMAEDEAETISSTLKEDWRANLGSRYSRKSARDRQ